jgi:hypothetical protein
MDLRVSKTTWHLLLRAKLGANMDSLNRTRETWMIVPRDPEKLTDQVKGLSKGVML